MHFNRATPWNSIILDENSINYWEMSEKLENLWKESENGEILKRKCHLTHISFTFTEFLEFLEIIEFIGFNNKWQRWWMAINDRIADLIKFLLWNFVFPKITNSIAIISIAFLWFGIGITGFMTILWLFICFLVSFGQLLIIFARRWLIESRDLGKLLICCENAEKCEKTENIWLIIRSSGCLYWTSEPDKFREWRNFLFFAAFFHFEQILLQGSRKFSNCCLFSFLSKTMVLPDLQIKIINLCL